MSDERDKRDDGTTGSTDSGHVDDSAADASSRAEAPSDHAREGEVSADESPTSAAPAGKPTGKRSARRAGTSESTEPAKTVQMAKTAKAVSSATSVKSPEAKSRKADKPQTENIFKRIRRFLREVIAELRKVIWPNRKQMITYTSVVLVFVAFMVAFIFVLDLGFAKGITWLFG
ncbi:preprotein translocase subunit SecE [Rhodococcus sp. TAF43]|uniref:preprotein translocase subunit SecE n=1 Tax=unclassified Rhodococcus (in: high G+C Gram-positive bacteria) TaxID=192944 RepID=UPI001581A6E8|nr:preprotein translocase subunit SecE [Rhodococcus sp. W8901]QKT12878.1 preprotein translocase subunit SecE [Rhodococcus sp. W8901]